MLKRFDKLIDKLLARKFINAIFNDFAFFRLVNSYHLQNRFIHRSNNSRSIRVYSLSSYDPRLSDNRCQRIR